MAAWYTKAGKDRLYIERKVKKKLASLKPKYKVRLACTWEYLALRVEARTDASFGLQALFANLDDDNNHHLTIEEFHEFYMACMQVRGVLRALSTSLGSFACVWGPAVESLARERERYASLRS